MSYRDLSTHNLGDSGAYGTIPESEYLRKIQATPTSYQQDSEQVEDYMRKLMKDFSPDKPYLASDDPRDPSDRGGGTHSTEILNLRHAGKRTTEDPYMADGEFLDFEFTELDPRGIATTPDMRKHMEQQFARASYIKFGNDEDWSVPESGINPVQMVSNIKSGMYQFRDRYKNFEDSFDGWHNGYNAQPMKTGGADINRTELTGDILNLADSSVRNRQDATAMLSNDPTIGYRNSTPDQKFKVAQYGLVRASQDKNYQAWDNNRKSTFADHANLAVIDGQRVNRMLATLIYDLEGRRYNKQIVAEGAAYGDSEMSRNTSKKLNPEDIYKILRIGGISTASETAHEQFDGRSVRRYGNKQLNNNHKTVTGVQVNHEVLESMQRGTNRQKERNHENFTDLREHIHETSKHLGLFNEASNVKSRVTESLTSNMARNEEYTHHIEDGKTTMNYAGVKALTHRNPHNNLEYEKFAKHSLQTQVRKGRREGYGINTPYDFENDIDRGRLDFGVYNKADKAPMRDHMGRNQYDMETDGKYLDEMQEIDIKMFNPA